jgi:GNAT superfamily N-acetyltransferase
MAIAIKHTHYEDVPVIFDLYNQAVIYQKTVGNNHWLGFEEEMIKKEIVEKRHYTIYLNEEIAGTFVVTFDDRLIWKSAPEAPAIYLHRIATAETARGNNLVKHIVEWAKTYSKARGLLFVRIDTGSGNNRLINHYSRCGFTVIATDVKVDYTPELPAHYRDGLFTLLEMPV